MPTPSVPETIPFSVYDGGAIVVPISIAGAGPYRFVLDTGSTRSAVTARLARLLRSPMVAQTALVTPAGRSTRDVTLVQGLEVGRTQPVSVAAMVVSDDALPRAGRVDGLLGQDVLAGQTFTIDYRRRELVWHDGGTAHVRGHRLPLTAANGLQFVSLSSLPGASGPARLVADSGADTIVLFGGDAGAMPSATPMGTGVLRTSAGIQLGRRVSIAELDIGGLLLRDQSALLLTEREATGLLGDGLLPLHLFARVTFDAAARALIVAAR
ncbi:MAG TPA: retropepsin-like aspartic protease [Vicinamibacterales bacterium]|nr:retropepsin-like aspartic protease [Vicinamibacterales bacterium]